MKKSAFANLTIVQISPVVVYGALDIRRLLQLRKVSRLFRDVIDFYCVDGWRQLLLRDHPLSFSELPRPFPPSLATCRSVVRKPQRLEKNWIPYSPVKRRPDPTDASFDSEPAVGSALSSPFVFFQGELDLIVSSCNGNDYSFIGSCIHYGIPFDYQSLFSIAKTAEVHQVLRSFGFVADEKNLIEAITDGNVSAVRLLVQAGIRTEDVLEFADENLEMFCVLFETGLTTDVDFVPDGHDDLLSFAISARSVRLFELLLKAGLDLNDCGNRTRTPLTLAVFLDYEGNGFFLRRLIEMGADIEKPDQEGNTPLETALMYANANNLSILLKAGCDIGKVSRSARTRLLRNQHLDQVRENSGEDSKIFRILHPYVENAYFQRKLQKEGLDFCRFDS